MKKTKFFKVYKEGKINPNLLLHSSKLVSGVYIIANPDHEIKYIGKATGSKRPANLYKTMIRHFQTWNDKQQERKVYPRNFLARVVICTPEQADKLETALIKRYNPPDNTIIPEGEEYTREERRELNNFINIANEDYPF